MPCWSPYRKRFITSRDCVYVRLYGFPTGEKQFQSLHGRSTSFACVRGDTIHPGSKRCRRQQIEQKYRPLHEGSRSRIWRNSALVLETGGNFADGAKRWAALHVRLRLCADGAVRNSHIWIISSVGRWSRFCIVVGLPGRRRWRGDMRWSWEMQWER